MLDGMWGLVGGVEDGLLAEVVMLAISVIISLTGVMIMFGMC